MSQSKFKPVQLSIFDPIYNLSPRQLRKLTDGWPGMFNQVILPELIELEDLFAPLYSSSQNSRPSTPTYLVLGMLVLKAMHGASSCGDQRKKSHSICERGCQKRLRSLPAPAEKLNLCEKQDSFTNQQNLHAESVCVR